MKTKSGQDPAFAASDSSSNTAVIQSEMSKRFYAACAAMQGLINIKQSSTGGQINSQNLVHKAFELADELLKQENNE